MKKQIDVITDEQKVRQAFDAVCDGKDCSLSYAELEALQSNGFITNLKHVRGPRWSFEWTDKLREYVIATPRERAQFIKDTLEDERDWAEYIAELDGVE